MRIATELFVVPCGSSQEESRPCFGADTAGWIRAMALLGLARVESGGGRGRVWTGELYCRDMGFNQLMNGLTHLGLTLTIDDSRR